MIGITHEQKIFESLGIPGEIKQIAISKYRINYLECGSGQPVILLHGANIGWGQWYKNIPELAKHYKVYALDLVGSGGSTKIDYARLDLEKDLVQIVDQFIRTLSLSAVSVVGHSLGGWIALRLALLKKTYIKKLILVDSLGFLDYVPWSQRILSIKIVAKLITATVMRPTEKKMTEFLKSVSYSTDTLDSLFVNYFYESIHREHLGHPLILIGQLMNFFKMRKELALDNQLKEIKLPTLIIVGDHDFLIPLEKAKPRFSLIPNVDIAVIKNAGHVPFIEQTNIWNELVVKFLSKS